MKLKQFGVLLVFLIGGLGISSAQVTASFINGIITDTDGSPLVGATIQAVHTPSGALYGTTTRDDGRFALPNVRIGGPYTIEVSYIGYKTQTREGVFLKLGEKFKVDFNLASDSETLETVTVLAERNPVIGEDRTGAETNITSDKLTRLPTISRSASDFTRLTPASDGNSFGGRNDQFNNFSLDGSIFNNPFGLDAATAGGQSGAQPISLDAIDQITVSLAPYDVTQSGFTGAAVNAVTKSGTNDFSGSVFGYFRNDGLTGSKISGVKQPKADLDQLQAGFTLGGPIIKNKLFFFINGEIDNRDDLGTTFVASAPGISGENVARVEAQDLQLVSNTLRDRFGYETGPYEGYIHSTNSTKGLAKLDWNINSSNSLVLTYNFLDAFQEKPAHPSAIGRRGPDFTTLQFANSGYRINNKIHSGILELRSMFGNNVSNKFQVGYTSYRDTRDPFSEPFPVININKDGVRYIVAGHEPFSIHNRLNQDVFQFTDNLNIYAGKHTITVGTSFERFAFDNSFNLDAYGGTFDGGFESVQAFVDSVNVGGFANAVAAADATFKANGGDDGVNGEGWALAETNAGQWGLYVQDEWEVSDNFNLTYGIRMDMPLYFDTDEKIQENLGRNCCHDPSIQWFDKDGNLGTVEHTSLPKQTPLFSPRIGFNYDVTGNGTRQLRGGSGLFSGRLPFVWLGNQVANPNWFFYNYTDNDFKFPQVWRTNLGYDHQLKSGWIATVDLIYTKDLNASIVRNAGLNRPTGRLQGVDNRPVYQFSDKAVFNGLGFPLPVNGYFFTNTDIGYSFNASFQIQRQFKNNMYVMLAYNFLDAKDASSIEAEISGDAYDRNPVSFDANNLEATRSLYGNRHRIIGSFYKTWEYGDWATTISAFLTYAQAGTTDNDNVADYRFNYTYSGDINGDGSGLNDLLYVPTDSELSQMNFINDAQRQAFSAYIEQDDYLSDNRGGYVEKYAITAPWYSQWDIRILQDLNLKMGENKVNTIQLSLDILNFGNLINSNWGVRQLPNNTQPLGVTVDENGVPTYSFDTNLTSTFSDFTGLISRWQARFGLRYAF